MRIHPAVGAAAMAAAALGVARAEPPAAIVIGHAQAAAVTNLPQATMDRIGLLRWYFTHASVGGNMIDGLTDLHGIDAARYRLVTASDDASPPAAPLGGRVYEYNRGNPGWQEKVDLFATCVSNGWRQPKVHLALNKFCYIDPDADVNGYVQSMAALETNFPETVFIYATIPLMTGADQDNYTRNVFNDALRGWVATNGRVLFDIADIEAHDTNGAAQTFTYNSRTCQRLFAGYSSDGGHLNALGSREVAKGFYAIGAALFQADRDGDGLRDGDELIAGTGPLASNSCFGVAASAPTGAGGVLLRWTSASNRTYTLQRRSALDDAAGWTNLLTHLPATPPMNTHTDAAAAAAAGFYRVGVQQ